MEQPLHDIRPYSTPAQAAPRRAVSVVIVALLHIGAIYALATGLAQNLYRKAAQEIKAEVIPPKQETVKPPPPPPPELQKPPPPFVPPPDIVIQQEAAPTNTITTQSKVATPPPPPKPVAPSGITAPVSYSRHSCDSYYPPVAQRLNQEGTILLKLTVGADGEVSNVQVANSSGHDSLDSAAQRCAQGWHYKPAMQNGQPIATTIEANVSFKMR